MTTLTMLWIASFLAALLFAGAGYFAARARRLATEAQAADVAARAAALAREKAEAHRRALESVCQRDFDTVSLQRFVDDVRETPAVSAAALTDELGFLVAGSGDHSEALAAFGAFLTDAGARASGLLPMNEVHKVSIEDDEGMTLTVRTIASTPNELVLVTLGGPHNAARST